QAFDRRDVGALRLHREHRARLHRAAVEMDRAGTALRGVATHVRAGELQSFTDELDQQGPRVDARLDRLAVHRQSNRHVHAGLLEGLKASGHLTTAVLVWKARVSPKGT